MLPAYEQQLISIVYACMHAGCGACACHTELCDCIIFVINMWDTRVAEHPIGSARAGFPTGRGRGYTTHADLDPL